MVRLLACCTPPLPPTGSPGCVHPQQGACSPCRTYSLEPCMSPGQSPGWCFPLSELAQVLRPQLRFPHGSSHEPSPAVTLLSAPFLLLDFSPVFTNVLRKPKRMHSSKVL